MLNFLNVADVGIPVFGDTFHISLNWIGNLIRWLINGVGIVGVGIILFSLVLKFVVMPFDIYQRITMRKQNNKIKASQERLDKLKKQYANDKDMYNQKMAELYKENGMSVCSSCLPMILSMIIFIVAINAFNAYAQYSNVENYNTMVNAYNAKIEHYCADLDNGATYTEVLGTENITDASGNLTGTRNIVTITVKDSGANDKFIYYKAVLPADEWTEKTDEEKAEIFATANKNYFIDVTKLYADATYGSVVQTNVAQALAQAEEDNGEETLTEELKTQITESTIREYFIKEAQLAVKDTYDTVVLKKTKFLWIKNIWTVDASYKQPVLTYSEFKSEASQEKFRVDGKKKSFGSVRDYTNVYEKDTYNIVTGELGQHKKEANGYYLLILLSIGTILLQQFVSMRSQKEQQTYSSVDGQGKSQQKMMMIIMTAMFAIFSFMYSSAFSIYMITSNVFSLISTIIINKIVDKVEEKKEAAAAQAKYNKRFPGRTYKGESKNNNKKGKK